jgi:hypothetical protein
MALHVVARFRPGGAFTLTAFLAKCCSNRSPRPALAASSLYANKQATDPEMQAMSGMAVANKDTGGQPWRIGIYKTEVPGEAGREPQAS